MDKQRLQEFAAFVGIDWADRKHDVCIALPDSDARERSVLDHRPAAIRAWAESLRERFGGAPVAVTLELEQGPIVSALLEHDFFVLFPVRPSMVAGYRKTFTPSGAKDDPTDAEIAVDLLLLHPDHLEPLQPDSAAMRSLRKLVESRRTLVQERTRLTNRITANLKLYFPQVLDWFADKSTPLFVDFLIRWPTLQKAQRAQRETLVKFFHAHNVRRADVLERRLEEIGSELPLHDDDAITLPAELLVKALLKQLRELSKSITTFDEAIAELAPELPDYEIFASLPGAGPALAPRLLVAFGERRERFPNAASMQKYAGVAPVTERSGKKCWVHWRWSCSKFLRQTFVEWVAQTIPRSRWAKAFYAKLRAKGTRHQAALRALAFKWIRILYRCWIERVPYDEKRYLEALEKRGSSLVNFAAEAGSA